MEKRTDLKIPYGVADFKAIRNEGLYYVDKTRFLANFEKLFGGLWLGAHPTPNRNRYLVLALDFSKSGATGGHSLEECFETYLSERFDGFIQSYPDVYDAAFRSEFLKKGARARFVSMTDVAHRSGIPIYLVIDEYDNFTNSLIRSSGKEPYRSITHGTGFYRQWFKQFKGAELVRCEEIAQ